MPREFSGTRHHDGTSHLDEQQTPDRTTNVHHDVLLTSGEVGTVLRVL
jgi:hypothetical protein